MSLIRASYKYTDFEKMISSANMLIEEGGDCKALRYTVVISNNNKVELDVNPDVNEKVINAVEDSYRHTSYALVWSATAYREAQDYSASIRIFEDYLRCMPNHYDNDYAAFRLSQMYKKLGDDGQAEKYASRIIKSNFREFLEYEP